jgi:hypothetical protein
MIKIKQYILLLAIKVIYREAGNSGVKIFIAGMRGHEYLKSMLIS